MKKSYYLILCALLLSCTFSADILITQRIEKDEDGKKYKYLSAMAGVGGLYIHSDDTYLILSKLKFVESGSETV